MKLEPHTYQGMVYYLIRPDLMNQGTIPLLMIHGHGGDHRGLEKLAQEVTGPVIIFDLPGFGDSKELSGPHTIENYVTFLQKFITELSVNRYNLLGHSLGSAIALTLAAEDPRVQRLLLLNPIPQFTVYIKYLIRTVNGLGTKMPAKMADAFVKARLYNLVTFLMHSRKRTDKVHAAEYLRAQNSAQYSFKTWSESGESIFFFDHIKIAQQIGIPTLVLHGDKDSLTTLHAIKEFCEVLNARLVRIAQAGHFLPLEHIKEAAHEINHFLDKNNE